MQSPRFTVDIYFAPRTNRARTLQWHQLNSHCLLRKRLWKGYRAVELDIFSSFNADPKVFPRLNAQCRRGGIHNVQFEASLWWYEYSANQFAFLIRISKLRFIHRLCRQRLLKGKVYKDCLAKYPSRPIYIWQILWYNKKKETYR